MKARYSYLELVALPTWRVILYKIRHFIHLIGWSICDLFYGLAVAFWHGIVKCGVQLKKMFIALRYGDWATKLSFLFLGAGYLKRKQIVKGVLLMVLEIAFVLFMIFFGVHALQGLFTLADTKYMTYICPAYDPGVLGDPDLFIDPIPGLANQIFEGPTARKDAVAAGCWFPEIYKQMSDSSKFLLFGVISIIVIVAFVIFYCKVTANAFRVECNKEEGKHVNTFKDDVGELLNGRFHITLLTLPIIGVVIFTVFPLIDMILMAFTNYDGAHAYPTSTFQWVGFKNFEQLFQLGGGSATFANTFAIVFRWTIVWAILATFSNFILGILVATIINRKGIRLKKMWRTFLVLSIALPQFVSLLAMSQFLSDTGALATILAKMTGKVAGKSLKILGNATTAKIVIVIVNIWIGVPYTVLSSTGILMNIPADLYESAKIDGANAWKMYTKITVPYIIFVLGPSLITTFIGNVNNFGVIFLLTGGGPKSVDLYKEAGRTSILITWLYSLTTGQDHLYYLASVLGIIIFIISAVLSLIVYRNSASYKNEEDFA